MSEGPADQSDALNAFKYAQLARAKGDLADARSHLEDALSKSRERPPIWLKLFEVDLLRSEGRLADVRELLQVLRLEHPENIWPAFHLASLARQDGDRETAWMHLNAILAQGAGDQSIWVRLLQADLMLDDGHDDEARAALDRAAIAFPAEIVPHQRLARLAELRGDILVARAHWENALAIDRDRLDLHLSVVRGLQAEGLNRPAIHRLQVLRDRFGDDMRILMQLVSLTRAEKDTDREQFWLTRAIETDSLDPGLLRHIFVTRARTRNYDELTSTLTQLQSLLEPDLADDLLTALQMQAMEFQDALPTLRRGRKRRETPGAARQLATALLGTHRYEIGLRYLRHCLRRWPADEGLWAVYVPWALKLGWPGAVAGLLDELGGNLPDTAVLEHRFTLAGFSNDLEGAVARYEKLRARGLDRPAQRAVLGKLIYTLQDLATADALFARISNPGAEDTRLLHRGGLVGMMTLEFDLERQALEKSGVHGSLVDWVRARPGSTIAAIRLVDDWCGGPVGQVGKGTASGAIPRKIFQYWDSPEIPPALRSMSESWAAVPGFEHRLMFRTDALHYLRRTMDRDWVRAFQLAQNAAQEADLLRLCLLAQEGGIWADADDCLYGDLDRVLGAGTGLILYREPLGGAVANNVVAAPAGHPVIVHAARLAREALLQRVNENAWNKTGPGLLTRALAHYLAQAGFDEARRGVIVRDWTEVTREISTHNPVNYKASQAYWNRAETRAPADSVWDRFYEEVQRRSGEDRFATTVMR